jgi:tRNA-specific adenosine deaminase 1
MLLNPSYQSMYLQHSEGTPTHTEKSDSLMPFAFKEDVSFHFFTTEAPCGDASMDLLIGSRHPADSVPWSIPALTSQEEQAASLLGRGYFSQLGAVRRKPARGDAEATLSKSCTDKLALKQFSSLLAFPVDMFVCQTANAFIQSVIVYEGQYDIVGYARAFGSTGRLVSVASRGAHFFGFRPLPVSVSRFPFDKNPGVSSQKASNVSALWIRGAGLSSTHVVESLLNGVKQGFKQFEERTWKESVVCRKQMWLLGQGVGSLIVHSQPRTVHDPTLVLSIQEWLRADTYHEAKGSTIREFKKGKKGAVIEKLAGWVSNNGDEEWTLDAG